jgi:acyl-CoA synthetase (AMP-forming)/AMP-acid ligase II
LRVALNGAEAVHRELSGEFEEQFARIGLRRNVLQPVYGLAENCVAVTMRPPEAPVLVRRFSREALASGEMQPLASSGRGAATLVGTGTPVSGTQVSIRSEDGGVLEPGHLGNILVSGSSTATWFADPAGELYRAGVNGCVDTGDVGAILEGELFIVGRSKEIFKHGGRTFAPPDIEHTLVDARVALPGGVGAFSVYDETAGMEDLIVIMERAVSAEVETREHLSDTVRLCILREFEIPVKEVVLIRPGGIPRTSSGKIKRTLLREWYFAGKLRRALPDSDGRGPQKGAA